MKVKTLPETGIWQSADNVIGTLLEHSRLHAGEVLPIINEALGSSTLDYQVRLVDRLPFRLERFNMIGVTLLGRVWLRADLLERPALSILSTLVHEGVHVAQQRRHRFTFYPRYIGWWIGNLVTPFPDHSLKRARSLRGRFHAAYRMIPHERAAYTEEARFRARLLRSLRQAGLPFDLF